MSDDAAKARADYVRALKEERHGYEVAGKTDRLAQVDEQLAKFGEAPVKRTAPKKAKAADE
ncbi:MAG: hypothetical protein U0R23_13135 [Candidatus Nanopelagicales bacterium]|jgi:hypothetical protein